MMLMGGSKNQTLLTYTRKRLKIPLNRILPSNKSGPYNFHGALSILLPGVQRLNELHIFKILGPGILNARQQKENNSEHPRALYHPPCSLIPGPLHCG